jgi:predicted ATP-grasp superfamily ATP-dependent carboligase
VLIIAPESSGALLDRCRLAGDLNPRPLNCCPDAVALCGDKVALFERLIAAGVPTLPTQPFDSPQRLPDFPLVIKPRCGAGSQSTYLCRDAEELAARAREFRDQRSELQPIVQPCVAGRALSAAGIFRDGCGIGVWPIAGQMLSDDGLFTYLGGEAPAREIETGPLHELIQRAADVVPGLSGYVGFDLLVPDDRSLPPLLVEINPRLTTSYVGYRRLARSNLAPLLLELTDESPEWRDLTIAYTADGTTREIDLSGDTDSRYLCER